MIEIKVSIEHSYFLDTLDVWMKWEFPFLPRIGESVSPWIWIEQNTFEIEKLKENLSEEGQKSLNDWEGELTDWLYEVGITADVVSNLVYFQNRADNTLYVHLFMQEDK